MAVTSEELKKILKERELKVTTQRVLVLTALAESQGSHLTVEEIYDLVKTENPEIGLATVYRTIQLFYELHLVDRINLDDGFVRYEIGDIGNHNAKHHHHHLICLGCGKVISFEEDLLEDLEKKIAGTTGFSVVDHEVKLYGYCKECGGKLFETEKN